jgi:hypothetical protein
MSDTLAQLIDKVQATLFDDGTLFPDANVTAAARLALNDINRQCPQHAAVTIAAIAAQLVYELNDADPAATGITGVVLEGAGDNDRSLSFRGYQEDGRWFFRLAEPQPEGQTLRAHYVMPYTIGGLDGALDSTLSGELNIAALHGAVYYCAAMRAARAVEANNVNPNVAPTWEASASAWKIRFRESLARARQAPPATGPAPEAAWNDPQHSDEYP